LLLSGCKTDFARFQDEAVTLASNDKKIDQNEYNTLVERIKASNDASLKQFVGPNNEIDHPKLAEHLLKLFTAKRMSLNARDIWQPEQAPPPKFNVDVYIENSASMDGYVAGATDFETAIYSLLGEIKTSDFCNDLNLNYINKQITYTKTSALPEDIQDFIKKLEPTTFKEKGGSRGVSDLQEILHTVIDKVDDKNAAILVSDFVFSPGKSKNAEEYLAAQKLGIKIDFKGKIEKFDLSAIVMQLQSKFNGTYYDKNNQSIAINGKRPYYVWIFGNSRQIKEILDKKILDSIEGGYLNRIVFTPVKDAVALDYKILQRPRIGEFKLASGAKGEITEAAVERGNQNKGIFGFNVAVNFSGGMQDTNYFLDAANYRLSNSKYNLTIEPIKDANDPATKGFTHLLKLQTDELRDETLKIDVVGKIPTWVENSTSNDDAGIASSDAERQKTFGLKYLIQGVSEAFYPQSSENIINTISISIKK
jgi:hypothetical protein